MKGRDPEPATVHLVHDIVRSGDEVQVMALSVTAERPKGRLDRVAVSGSLCMGPRPHLQLHGSLDAFDARLVRGPDGFSFRADADWQDL